MRVLIVDDSKVMRMILERGLRSAGLGEVEVRQAANGLEALDELERAGQGGVDLMLCDIHMPVMDGPELLAEMERRGLGGGMAVVLISAEGGDVSGMPDRSVGRLVKPFTIEQMQASLVPLLHAGVAG